MAPASPQVGSGCVAEGKVERCTLGDCLRAANRPKDALIAYLHTDLLYSKDKEEYPRALDAIADLFRQLKQDARADEFAQWLKQEYPRSPWVRSGTQPR